MPDQTPATQTCGSDGCDKPATAYRDVILRDIRHALTPVVAVYVLCGGHATWYESEGYACHPLEQSANSVVRDA